MSTPKISATKGAGQEPGNGATIIKVTVVIVVLLIAFVAIAKEYSAETKPPIPMPPALSAQQQSTNTSLRQLAEKCMGNFNQLSPADQAQANQLSNGQGAISISLYYRADPSRTANVAPTPLQVNANK